MVKIKKKCPVCGIIANGEREIEKIFGFRMINGIKRPQSYCRVDRSAKIKTKKKAVKKKVTGKKS